MTDNEHEQLPTTKRKRVTRACLQCAKSRRKCDGVQPECGTCRTSGAECAWSDIPTRRGPPKGYKRGAANPDTLYPKILKIREHVQTLVLAYGEKVVKEELQKALFGPEPYVPGPASVGSSNSGPGASGSDTSNHRGRSKGEQSQDDPDEHSTSDVDEGSSSGMTFLATMRNLHSPTLGTPYTPVSNGQHKKFSPWALDELESGRRKCVPARAPIPQPTPAEVEILLRTYWSKVHPHWPILYKPLYDISIFRISTEVPLALLYSVYALAARLAPTSALDAHASQTFRKIAEEQVLQGEGSLRSDIDICTALFLLSLHYHGEGQQRQAWILCGVAAMMALDLGLHRLANSKLPLVEHERRVRIFWNIYVYEKVLAAEMGRPFTIHMKHCDSIRLSEEQPDEYETTMHPGSGQAVRLYTISVFNSAVSLFHIFERILNEVHTLPLPTTTRSARERLVAELERELEEWQGALGPKCAYPRPDDIQPTRSLYLTHAWYLVAIILLHRPLIPRTRQGQPFVSNAHHKKATDAANRLVDLLAQFAAGQDIDKLPPNDAYLIFTAALLHVYNLSMDDRPMRDNARRRLEQCIEWLKGLSATWHAASSYKRLLDAFSEVASTTISHTLSPTSSQHSQSQAGLPNQNGYYVIPQSQPQSQSQIHSPTHSRSQSASQLSYQYSHPAEHVAGERPSSSTPTSATSMPPPEAEQNLTGPELFGLDNYYWNEFQTVNMANVASHAHQQQMYYAQTYSNELAPTPHNGVYLGVRRLLEDGTQLPRSS